MPLQLTSAQLYAFAMLFRSSPSHCDSIQIFAMPLQYNSLPFITFAMLVLAMLVDTKPLRIGATLCRSVHRHCGSKRLSSNLRLSQATHCFSFAALFHAQQSLCDALRTHAFPKRHFTVPCLCTSAHFFAMAAQSAQSFAIAHQFIQCASHLCPCNRLFRFTSAMLSISSPCLCLAIPPLLRNTVATLRVSVLCHRLALQSVAQLCHGLSLLRRDLRCLSFAALCYTLAAHTSV